MIIGVACQCAVDMLEQPQVNIYMTPWRESVLHNLLVVRPKVLFFIVRLFYDQLWPKGNGQKGERRQLFGLVCQCY